MLVTDGPYTETKEHIGGFWILEAVIWTRRWRGRERVPSPAVRRVRCARFFFARLRHKDPAKANKPSWPLRPRNTRRSDEMNEPAQRSAAGSHPEKKEEEKNNEIHLFRVLRQMQIRGHGSRLNKTPCSTHALITMTIFAPTGTWPAEKRSSLQKTALTVYWKNGKVATTDGPYAETKEQVGGILVLEARDMNHAVQLIGQHPALTYGNIFEIRPAGDMSGIMKASEHRPPEFPAAAIRDGLVKSSPGRARRKLAASTLFERGSKSLSE